MHNSVNNPSSTAPQYTLFVDESGDHVYNLLEVPKHRYLALLGVWFTGASHDTFKGKLESFKEKLFPDWPKRPIILNRQAIISGQEAFGRLKTDPVRRGDFDSGLLHLVSSSDFKLVIIILDKKTHKERYVVPEEPYHYCWAVLLERFCGFLAYKQARGEILAESRNPELDRKLESIHMRAIKNQIVILLPIKT